MYALSDDVRQQLTRLALMIVCGGTLILPFTVPPTSPVARSQTSSRTSTIAVPDVPGRLEFPSITVERDPFVADAIAASSQAIASTPSNDTEGGEIGIVLPPNAGAQGALPSVVSSTVMPVVRGIILGEAPQALVELGNAVKVVSVGDAVGNDTVKSIDANGVVLASGLRLRITSALK